mmetsp:Transcript_28159/g.91277  ORF Transcript_28159/g.91277 Transcript_28159/m.91277 type:complete len:83 (+) Transcript_28159:73-321(+)
MELDGTIMLEESLAEQTLAFTATSIHNSSSKVWNDGHEAANIVEEEQKAESHASAMSQSPLVRARRSCTFIAEFMSPLPCKE